MGKILLDEAIASDNLRFTGEKESRGVFVAMLDLLPARCPKMFQLVRVRVSCMKQDVDRSRGAPHGAALPHHRTYGSRTTAVQSGLSERRPALRGSVRLTKSYGDDFRRLTLSL